jgi:hypothetical protein
MLPGVAEVRLSMFHGEGQGRKSAMGNVQKGSFAEGF